MENKIISFPDHYKRRVNSGYQEYFEKKYRVFLNVCTTYGLVKEEGIGIGSVSKALRKAQTICYGSDVCPEMLNLCRENNPGLFCFQEDMLDRKDIIVLAFRPSIVVTHGVIEHFSDSEISSLLDKYTETFEIRASIHYIPTNGYAKPSIGDERLLPIEYWVDTFSPSKFIPFNENKDLVLIFKH